MLVRFLEMILAVVFVIAVCLALWPAVDPELGTIVAASAAAFGAMLFLLPAAVEDRAMGQVGASAVFAGLIAFTLALAAPAPGASVATAAALGLATALITALVGSYGALLRPFAGDARAALAWPSAVLLALAAAPIWLGPLIFHAEPEQGVTDTLIALSPLTHLAVPAGVDYLRSDWFYRHTPFGGLRYDYPTFAAIATGYLLACTLAWAAAPTRGRRAPTASATPSLTPQPRPNA